MGSRKWDDGTMPPEEAVEALIRRDKVLDEISEANMELRELNAAIEAKVRGLEAMVQAAGSAAKKLDSHWQCINSNDNLGLSATSILVRNLMLALAAAPEPLAVVDAETRVWLDDDGGAWLGVAVKVDHPLGAPVRVTVTARREDANTDAIGGHNGNNAPSAAQNKGDK